MILDPETFRALAIAQALEIYANTRMKVNRNYTPMKMILMANKITGHNYHRGQYRFAAAALREHVLKRK